jgi:DNA-directed RNA polymerase alpha subunit
MSRTVLVAFVAATLSAPAFAQDSKVKSRTDIKADDAKVISMVGCLRSDPATNSYSLVGHVAAAGDDITAKSKVKTDVDKDKTKVEGKTEVKGDKDKAVATAGDIATYALLAAPDVNLASSVGKIKDETKVEREDAPDSKSNSKTKLELPRSPNAAYTVVSMKSLGTPCAR